MDTRICPVCGSEISNNIDYCPFCNEREKIPPQAIDVHMAWYNFLVWIQIPLNMVQNLYTAINTFIEAKNPMYILTITGKPSALLNITYGLFIFSTVIFSAIVHYALRKRNINALKMVILFNLIPVISSIIDVPIYLYLGISCLDKVAAIVAGTALAVINYIYFGHRKHMFTFVNFTAIKMSHCFLVIISVTYFAYMIVRFLSYPI